MAFLLQILFALSLSAQTVVSVSPGGDTAAGLEPLIKIRFSAAVEPNSLRDRITIVWGTTAQSDGFITYPEGYRMPINQLAWNPATNTLYAKPDEALDHDRLYTVQFNGQPISRFKTTNVIQTILSRRLGPTGSIRRAFAQTVDLTEMQSLVMLAQTSTRPEAALTDIGFPLDVSLLTALGLGKVVFLTFESSRGDRVAVHAWLPSKTQPITGWPVRLVGHGLFDHRFSGPSVFASAFINNSVVMSIDAVGHGYGPNSILRFTKKDGTKIDVPTAGRGQDLNLDGKIDAGEGCILIAGDNPDFISTCLRETALDYQKLVREIQSNIDLDGDGQGDLNPNSIQYLGQSLGAMYGTILTAIEPGIDAAVLNVGGGSAVETARTSLQLKPIFDQYFATFYPDLAGVRDPLTPRYMPAQVITTKQGQVLEVLDRLSTIEAPGAPASFAPFLKQATIYGNPIKRVLFQYALGDQTIPNNSNGQLIRGAFEYELVSVYRHDIARAVAPTLPANPHIYMAAFGDIEQAGLLVALATLSQAADFLNSPLRQVPDVNGLVRFFFKQNIFETPTLIP